MRFSAQRADHPRLTQQLASRSGGTDIAATTQITRRRMAILARRSVCPLRARRESVRGNAASDEQVIASSMSGTVNPLGARRQKTDLHISEPTVTRSASPAPSLRSQRAKQYRASLPVRTARLLQRSRAHTPSSEGGVTSGTEGSASPAPAPPATATLLQDVVDIKTLLLQLKRVLHEPGEEHHTMSSETLDPLLLACAESPARGNGRRLPPHTPAEHTAELRRQILYLQSQVEERDRLVRVLQQQMSKLTEGPQPHAAATEDTCNVATQTDRLRPPVATNLTNTENSGLVSWSEPNGRKLSTYSEAQKTKRAVANGLVGKCQCGRRLNGLANGLEPAAYDKRSEPVQLKNNSRVGSRYLQAVSAKDQGHKRDLSVNERLLRKNALYSRSIENFHQSLGPLDVKRNERSKISLDSLKHHTSYSDLCFSKSNVSSPIQNGQSTDTDYSSDGGYKSLPSSINCNSIGSGKKVSGIPRRSVERRIFSSKPTVKASAI